VSGVDLAAVRSRIAAIRRAAGTPAPPVDLRRDLRELVLVGSSSRGGSSIFSEVLRRTVDAVHLRGESNPTLRLHGLAPRGLDPRGDALTAADPVPPGLLDDLAWECGRPATRLPDAQVAAYARDLACRLTLQWPRERFTLEALTRDVEAVRAELSGEPGWSGDAFPSVGPFFARLLARLAPRHPTLDPTLYDLDADALRAALPGLALPAGPPAAGLEEPPLVAIGPWTPATPDDLARRPLVVKTPGNAYRAAWFEVALPAARVRHLHLTRNVAASVNGLVDGWRHRGFHAHEVPGALSIAGYSERVAGGRDWWKFDLPPGWTDWRQAPLPEVCAFQWRSAHQALLDTIARGDPTSPRLRFEGFLANPAATVEGLLPWLGASLRDGGAALLSGALPAVMSTQQPRHRRWFARAELLDGVLRDRRNLDVMDRLGYDPDPRSWL